MMKNLTLVSFLILSFILFQCQKTGEIVFVHAGKSGGIYEGNEHGKIVAVAANANYNGPDTVRVDSANYLSFDQFETVVNKPGDIPTLSFTLKEEGKNRFEHMTRRNLNKRLYMIIDNQVVMAPTILTPISDGIVELSMTNRKELDRILAFFR